MVPSSYTVPYPLTVPGRRPFAQGGFADVYRLTSQWGRRDEFFAVKAIRVSEQDPVEKINKVLVFP